MATRPPQRGLAYDVEPTSTGGSSWAFWMDTLRRRPAGRRLLSVLTGLLFFGGIALFAYPVLTDFYTENFLQERLQDELTGLAADDHADWAQQVQGEQGAALTTIALPSIEVETVVVEGTSAQALRAGAGHYPNTPLPGQPGNVAIAGHRTTYGRPFNRVDELMVGETVWLATPIGDFEYEITDPPTDGECTRSEEDAERGLAACTTHPRDWSVIGNSSRAVLTLTSCHPKGSAAERIIVRAELVERHPAGTYQPTTQGSEA